ncbi:MAG: MATE family efflux transporter [Rubinisphaera brasiliensis]|uniref:MATE family efflux transporter n=1 Tax=Rubinisphaera brasiliensis TaxID=119 RepID=UPI00391895F0|nr:MATE family efflux transporter [bacterium]
MESVVAEKPPLLDESRGNWWTRPAGAKEVLYVALPLVVSSLSWTVMTFVDRVFLKWESGVAMAAAFSASTLWFALLCLPLGICMYCATFVSQYYGNHQYSKVGPAVWQGAWISLALTPLMMLAIPLAPFVFGLAGHEPDVQNLEIRYFQILCYGIPAMLLAQAFSAFYAGRGKTRMVMCVDSGVAILNLVLDYFWIFGKAGFPAAGIDGAGWATVTSLWVKAAIYFLLLTQQRHRREFHSLHWAFDGDLFRRVLYYGAPSGFQLVIDVLGFTIFIMLVGRLGAVEAEATSMAFSIATLAFMPIWGFAQAVSILVGQHLGENRDDLSARATWTLLQISLCYMSFISALYLFVPGLFLAPFFGSIEAASTQEQVWNLSVNLLRFVAAYNLLDATLMVFVSAIKGAGDTPFVLKVSGIMASTMAFASWMAVEVWHLGIYGCWALLTCWVWTVGIIFCMRFLSGKWRKMRVIEQKAFDPALEPVQP